MGNFLGEDKNLTCRMKRSFKQVIKLIVNFVGIKRLLDGEGFTVESVCQPLISSLWLLDGAFENTGELECSSISTSKVHIFQCMGKIFYMEFQSVPLKFHTKYLVHTLKDVYWNMLILYNVENRSAFGLKNSKAIFKRPLTLYIVRS